MNFSNLRRGNDAPLLCLVLGLAGCDGGSNKELEGTAATGAPLVGASAW